MDLRFYIDPETGEPHLYRHGVSEEEAEDVLARLLEDRPGRDRAHLRVVYVPDCEPGSVFVITAFDLGANPLRALRRRRKRKR